MRIRGENPVYKYGNYDQSYDDSYSSTYGGVVTKTTVLLGIIAIVALYFANTLTMTSIGANIIVPILIAPIIAIIAVIVTHRVPAMAFPSSLVYAICEGIFLGFVSKIYAIAVGGEVIQMALIGTFGVLAGMLFLYSTGIIRVGGFFRKLMISALVGLLLMSILMVVLNLTNVISLQGNYSLYIGVSIFSVILSSLFLLMDFDRITTYVDAGAPKNAEWSLSLGLVVTIVWIYVELLRLIAIISRRN